ncbi:MAG: hypothetical protein V5A30_06600 [Haloarculaceae archaeon]
MGDHRPDPDDEERSGLTRRRLVASGAAGWATVSLAGCSRLLDPGVPTDAGDGGGDGNGAPTGTTTVTSETTTTGNGTVTNGTATDGQDGSGGETTTQGGNCANVDRFAAGMDIGLHVNVFDDVSGDHLGADTIEGVTIEFPTSGFEPLELNWEGDHEAYADTTWGGKVSTSEDHDPGTYRYEVTIHKGDGTEETVVDEFSIV